ncbi:hypothetical protein [Flavobacterium sp.]|jgi:hypothetical protein
MSKEKETTKVETPKLEVKTQGPKSVLIKCHLESGNKTAKKK